MVSPIQTPPVSTLIKVHLKVFVHIVNVFNGEVKNVCVFSCVKGYQRGLLAAVCGFTIREEQGVFDEHCDGAQDERHEQVEVDVVPHAVESPVNTHTHANIEKCVYRVSGCELTGGCGI